MTVLCRPNLVTLPCCCQCCARLFTEYVCVCVCVCIYIYTGYRNYKLFSINLPIAKLLYDIACLAITYWKFSNRSVGLSPSKQVSHLSVINFLFWVLKPVTWSVTSAGMKQQTRHLFMTWNFPLYKPRTVPKCSRHASCTAWRSEGGIDTLSLSIRCPYRYVVSTYTLSRPIRCPALYVVPIDTLSRSIYFPETSARKYRSDFGKMPTKSRFQHKVCS